MRQAAAVRPGGAARPGLYCLRRYRRHDPAPITVAPNILWFVPSQWRGQAVGYAGDPNARTPRLDRFAAEGVRCDTAVANHPYPTFAKAAYLTGRLSPGNGLRYYGDVLSPDVPTIATVLGTEGWTTAHFGKWQLGPRDPTGATLGEAHARVEVPEANRGGFRIWESFNGGCLLRDPILHGNSWAGPRRFEGYQPDVLVDRFAAFLEGAIEPWLAVIHVDPPHPPYDVEAPGVTPPDPSSIVLRGNVPRGGDIEAKARRELAGYYAHIEATDASLGRLLDLLDGQGLAERTLVAFFSNHGDMHGSQGSFRKGWPYEESIRVPMVFRWPGVLPAGAVRREPAGIIDLLPTCLALAGMPVPAGLDGRDLSGWLRTGEGGPEGALLSLPDVPPIPFQCDRQWRAVRTQDSMLVVRSEGLVWLLHDLRGDPEQIHNIHVDPTSTPLVKRALGDYGDWLE